MPVAVLDHLEWAARIACAVGKAYRLRPCSQEEDDLVSIAHLTLCRKAPTSTDPESP